VGVVIVGAQFGDEGKGKIVDFYAKQADLVVRFNGGNNAGHTVVVDGEKYKFHLIPSGVVYGKELVIGSGVVVDPEILLHEIEGFGGEVKLTISERAHVIFDFNKEMDRLFEEFKSGLKAGSTGRGIAPTYADKSSKFGIRVGDLLDENVFRKKLRILVDLKNKEFEVFGSGLRIDFGEVFEKYKLLGQKLKDYVGRAESLINEVLDRGGNVLFEGAQGTLLDLDYGIYPFGTSSSVFAGGACTGAGVSPRKIRRVVGVVKAYTSRVGEGPLVTELRDDVGEFIREKGHEFGTTTGRPRRCGWLDAVVLKHACMLNRFDGIAITKLDVLGGLDKVKICVGYNVNGNIIDFYPSNISVLENAEPVYEEFDGWPDFSDDEWSGLCEKGVDYLPLSLKNYVLRVSEICKAPVYIVSLGPSRKSTICLKEVF